MTRAGAGNDGWSRRRFCDVLAIKLQAAVSTSNFLNPREVTPSTTCSVENHTCGTAQDQDITGSFLLFDGEMIIRQMISSICFGVLKTEISQRELGYTFYGEWSFFLVQEWPIATTNLPWRTSRVT